MALGSPMFRKLLLTALLLIMVTVVMLDLLLSRYTVSRERSRTQSHLATEAAILAGEAEALTVGGLAAWTRTAAQRAECRVTFIDPGGVVLADSEADAAAMDNHADRPEVAEALKGRRGESIRRSESVGRELVYVAVPVTVEGRGGYVLRLAVPLHQVNTAVAEVRRRLAEASLVAGLLALGIAYLWSRMLTNRIARVKDFAERLAQAQFAGTLPPGPDDELGQLARSLNSTAQQLRDVMESLRLESARREAILAGMVEGVLAVDHELTVTFCNQAFARAVGARYPVPERLPVLELMRDPSFLELLSRILVSGEPRQQRLQLAAAEGHSFRVQASPLDLKSGRGAIAILHDVTDLERLERVRRDFVANVSHELRTPLAAIQGYAETLLNGALEDSDNNRKFLEIIKAHAVRLNQISSDLLALSQIESDLSVPPLERVRLREVIDAAVRSVEAEAGLRGVAVHHRGEAVDGTVLASIVGLEQVLVNLLDNAVKFNRPGGEVWIETGTEEDGTTRIVVADNGIGIPSEDLPRIFERFYRVDKARSRAVGGTGLGLSIVKHAIERMNGRITVESQLGRGSRFTVLLPAG